MARKRISEFRAKTLLYEEFGQEYEGIQITSENSVTENLQPQLFTLNSTLNYIVKVDQGVKGRFKKGLILLNKSAKQIPEAIKELRNKGYSQFLIEEMHIYDSTEEKYLSIERTRDGYKILYSDMGGVNIEQHKEKIKELVLPYSKSHDNPIFKDEKIKDLDGQFLQKLLYAFDKYYFSFLEINPFIIQDLPAGRQGSKFLLLDAAVEVDSTAEFFVNNAWAEKDYTGSRTKERTEEEINVQKLAAKSQAAFSLEVLNENGSIFMMLSGGGASITLADETYNQGFGKELSNYGEYSGNPNAEESYIYAKNLLQLLLKSKAEKKVLIIAGGVANFTDVRVTFNGLIKALNEVKNELHALGVKIFVRRGGPYQEEGLAKMKEFLEKEQLLGIVSGPEMVLTEIVTKAIEGL